MANLMATAAAKLAAIQKASAGKTVTIRRRTDSTTATATISATPFTVEDSEGNIVEQFESRDYLIDAADYSPTGTVSEPERGDQIIESLNSIDHVYEVMSPPGLPVFHYLDRYRIRLRIHTKLVNA
jgi:hypothetical protein